MNVSVRLLGPVEVSSGNGAIGLGGPKPRALLAMLALEAGSTVSTDRLIDGLWGEEPPPTAHKLIQVYVSHLRKALSSAGADGVIVTRGHGYELHVDRAQVDATRFERLLAQGAARDALRLWRGSPLSDVCYEPFAAAEMRRLNELRSAALEVAIDQDLEAGRHREVLPELESLLGQEPLRERLHAQRILALYRCGRQADALEAYRQARATLINDVGVEPGPELRRLHEAILRQDSEIDAPATERLAELATRTSQERAQWRITEDDFAAGVVELQDRRQRRAQIPGAEPACPFKGLSVFDVDDADVFFGRERLIADMVARLAGSRLMAVVGPSGSGKSSAVRAGLLPALADGLLPGSEQWPNAIARPGHRPLDSLQRALGDLPPEGRSVLVVDQFEETFTACDDETQRAAFVRELIQKARDPRRRILVVVVIRADFYGKCAAYPDLSRMLDANTVLVGPMRGDEMRRAIELPAGRAGLQVEPALVDALISDVEGEPGALPLLSTALLELWQRSGAWLPPGAATLRLTSYAEIGGVRGAVARLAEAAYTRLDPDQQQRARRILLRLAGDGDVRLRVPLADLGAAGDVLSVLAQDRLVTIGDGDAEVAHEALLREWPRLVTWLEEDAEGRRLHRHLAAAAGDWDTTGREVSDLFRGSRLAAAAEWAAAHAQDLNDVERDFLDASLAASEVESEAQRRTNRRLRTLLSGVAGLLILALAAGGVALWQGGEARDAALIADARRVGAEALTQERLTDALLLARAGVELHPSVEAHSNLLSVLLRDPATLGELRGDGWPLDSLAVSADDSMVAVGDERGNVTVYDVETRTRLSTPYRVTAGFPQQLAFSADGTTLAVTSTGQSTLVDLVDPRTGQRQQRIELPPFPQPAEFILATTVFHPNGRDLIVQQSDAVFPGGPPSVLTRVDSATGEALRASVPVGGSNAWNLVTTADRRRLFVSSPGDDATYEVDPDTLRIRRTYNVGDDTAAVNADGGVMAFVSSSGRVRLLDLGTGRVRRLAGRHSGGRNVVIAVTPDGGTVASAAANGEIVVWDVASGTIRERIDGHEDGIWALTISADGRTLYSAGADSRLAIWDLAGDRRLDRRFDAGPPIDPWEQSPKGLAVSPDGRSLAITQADGSVDLLDATTLTRRTQLEGGGDAGVGVAFSPDGAQLAATDASGSVTVWDLATGREVRRMEGSSVVTAAPAVAFSPDSRRLVVAQLPSGDQRIAGRVRMYDLDDRTAEPMELPIAASSLSISPDGRLIAAVGDEMASEVRDLQTGEVVATLETGDSARSVAYSPDGRLLAVGHSGGSAVVLSTGDYKPVGQRMNGHRHEVMALQFSPDGRRLLTGSGDGTVRMWDVASQEAIGGPLTVKPKALVAAAFTASGGHVIAVPHAGPGVRWDVRTTAWEQHACTLAGRSFTAAEWREELPNRPYRELCPRPD